MHLQEWYVVSPVGHSMLDSDHQKIDGEIRELTRLFMIGAGRDVLVESLLGLEASLREHFEREDAAMRKSRYPGMHEHIREHSAFLTEFNKTVEGIVTGVATPSPGIQDEIQRWIVVHVFDYDQPLANYLNRPRPAGQPQAGRCV